jgi:hypothetical protein
MKGDVIRTLGFAGGDKVGDTAFRVFAAEMVGRSF